MSSPDKEYLKELLESFYEAKLAEAVREDISKGQEILSNQQQPRPDNDCLNRIKAKVAARLEQQQQSKGQLKALFKAVAIAAILFGLVSIANRQFKKQIIKPVSTTITGAEIWGNGSLEQQDADVTSYTEKIEDIENEIYTVRFGGYNGNGDTDVSELEFDIIEVSTDFWKG